MSGRSCVDCRRRTLSLCGVSYVTSKPSDLQERPGKEGRSQLPPLIHLCNRGVCPRWSRCAIEIRFKGEFDCEVRFTMTLWNQDSFMILKRFAGKIAIAFD